MPKNLYSESTKTTIASNLSKELGFLCGYTTNRYIYLSCNEEEKDTATEQPTIQYDDQAQYRSINAKITSVQITYEFLKQSNIRPLIVDGSYNNTESKFILHLFGIGWDNRIHLYKAVVNTLLPTIDLREVPIIKGNAWNQAEAILFIRRYVRELILLDKLLVTPIFNHIPS